MIVRNRPSKDFTIVRNNVLERTDLSLKAKGLYAFLMSKPDGWQITVMGLAAQLKEGKEAIMAALHELEVAGFYRKVERRDSSGHFVYDDYLYDEPLTEKPHAGKPHAGEPTQVNTDRVKTDLVKTDRTTTNVVEQAPVFGDAGVNSLIAIFEEEAGRLPRGKYQRYAAHRLIQRYGLDKALSAAKVALAAGGQPYAPEIHSPLDLEEKMPKLVAWFDRQARKGPAVINISSTGEISV